MANVFKHLQVFQRSPSQALLVWDLDPAFTPGGRLTFIAQWSRSGHVDGDDWVEVGRVYDQIGGMFQTTDTKQHSWSQADPVFYRVIVELEDGTRFSSQVASPDFMNFTASEMLIVGEVFRQTAFGFTSGQKGICGLLYRRRNWGQRASTVDPVSGSVVNPRSAEDYGTGYVGGFWPPFSYCIANAPVDLSLYRADLDTRTSQIRRSSGLAWPVPRTEDVWVDGRSGDRYFVQDVQEQVVLHGIPLVVTLELRKASPTDVIYKLELPQ